jgi:hypothetical protein
VDLLVLVFVAATAANAALCVCRGQARDWMVRVNCHNSPTD